MKRAGSEIDIKFIHLSIEKELEFPHYHKENQMLFFISGAGTEIVENEKFKISPGTFMLIPERKMHFFKPSSEKISEILSVRFKVLKKEENKFYFNSVKRPVVYKGKKEDVAVIKKIIHSLIEGKPQMEYFLDLLQKLFDVEQIGKKGKIYKYMEKVEKYIGQNMDKTIKIKDVAKYCGISSDYVRKIVRKVYGISFTKFVNKKKIDYSTTLLLQTDLPIKRIAGRVGFYDYNYFSRVFKIIKGVSPTKYRKNPI